MGNQASFLPVGGRLAINVMDNIGMDIYSLIFKGSIVSSALKPAKYKCIN